MRVDDDFTLPWSRPVALYEEALGRDALVRQARSASYRFLCCGEERERGHHPCCAQYEPPLAIEGQESLF